MQLLRGHEILIAFIVFFLAGICFGIVIGLRMGEDRIELTPKEEFETIKAQAELAEQLERVITIYNEQLKEVMQNYMQALKILETGGDTE